MALLTVSDAARRIGVASGTVRLWADTGKLKSIRTLSGLRLFQDTDVEALRRVREAARG
jgi:excisionase family DNA binding protein